MNNFDYKQFLSEGKLHEAELRPLSDEQLESVAQRIADEFTADDIDGLDLQYVITPNSLSNNTPRGGGFDLDVERGPNTPGDDFKDDRGFSISNYLGAYAGGSYVIRPNPDKSDEYLVTNAAMRNAKVARVYFEGDTLKFEMLPEDESIPMSSDEVEAQRKKEREMANVFVREEVEMGEVMIGNYQTKHFDVCPGAQGLYKRIVDEKLVDDMDLVIRSAKLHDALFAIEKEAMKNGASELDAEAAQILADQIMVMAEMMGLKNEHSYVQAHANIVKDNVRGDMNEEKGKFKREVQPLKMKSAYDRDYEIVVNKLKSMSKNAMMKLFGVSSVGELIAALGSAAGAAKSMEEGEEKKLNKMKKSELKEMIKTAMLNEQEEEKEEVDIDMDMDIEDKDEVGLTGDKKIVDDSLEAALEAARALGDEKLVDQIGNTITFFTRSQIVGDTANENINEEMEKDVKKEAEEIIKDTLKKEGGAAGLKPLVKAVKKLGLDKKEVVSLIKKMGKVKKHEDGDYILTPINETNDVNEAEGSTLEISDEDMKKLHSDGKIEIDGHKVLYKVKENLNESVKRMQRIAGIIK